MILEEVLNIFSYIHIKYKRLQCKGILFLLSFICLLSMVVVKNNIMRNACANEEDKFIIRDKTIIILELY
jgi:hypothetical protein